LRQSISSFAPAAALVRNFGYANAQLPPSYTSTRLFQSSASGQSDLRVLSKIAVTANNGNLVRVRHHSKSTGTEMTFAIFLPSSHKLLIRSKGQSTPALFWLSGLTCDDTNFSSKAGAFEAAEEHGIALVIPDTSPRGDDVPDDEGYDLGQGAGFYVDATEDPWKKNFKMYQYITEELPALVQEAYGIGEVKSICGHSMGGHGALTIAFKDSSAWTSVSAFAPICHPTKCPWGAKAFTNYFGSVDAGNAHDAALLLKFNGPFAEYDDILIDQGLDDQFLSEQLMPEELEKAAKEVGQKLTVRRQTGHDHSYYFISSFINDHIKFHAKRLKQAAGKLRASRAVRAGGEDTAGKPIRCKAMVARAPKEPLSEEEIIVDPPKAGEVRVKVIANALCHTDIYT
jgi:S-(hydroxymethyl)glutathione dehydrogenase/alcohol dehydrogenase